MPDMLPPQKVLKAGSPKGKRIREPSKGKKYTSKYSKCQELGHNIRSYSVLTTDSNKKQKKGDQVRFCLSQLFSVILHKVASFL